MHQQRLLVRARALARLKTLPDSLLGHLLSQSDPLPERVPQGVILFRQGERIQDWYLLLSGEVQLFLEQQLLTIVRPGTIFGEIVGQCHSCAAKILKTAEFVRIKQKHFLCLYNKWADQLQPCMLPMEDLSAISEPSTFFMANGRRKVSSGRQLPRSPSAERRKNYRIGKEGGKNDGGNESNKNNAHLNGFSRDQDHQNEQLKSERNHQGRQRKIVENGQRKEKREREGSRGIHLLDLGPKNPSIEAKIQIATEQLGRVMSVKANSKVAGSEFCANFHVLWVQCLGQPPTSHLIPIGVGQALLDRAYLFPARADHQPQFVNSSAAIYHWTSLPIENGIDGEQNYEDSLMDSLLLLANVGADSLLQCILKKSEEKRAEDELELVREEMNHIRAFNHLSRGMKRGLAKVMGLEMPEHAGTVIFKEGEPARSWFVVLRGTLEAKANGRRSILREGDDFGKLALLNGNPCNNNNNGHHIKSRRQATVVTAQDGCQLLRVDSSDFQRILREVESDTIRLKQTATDPQKDELVLQRDPKGRHSLVAGMPEKILEYILETRVELGPEEYLLEEALLTQPIWMPSNRLCDALKLYYSTGSLGYCPSPLLEFECWPSEYLAEFEQSLAAKRRTVQFVIAWQNIFGLRFFLDPIANSFVEEMYSCLLEDIGQIKMEMANNNQMDTTMDQMQELMGIREKAMQRLCLPSRIVLDCGTYSSNAPAPNPVLPSDICNQSILLPDSSQITLKIRLDQNANEIAKLARLGRQHRPIDQMGQNNWEECCLLFEISSDGQKMPIVGEECSVPTMLSPGAILLATLPSEIGQIPIFPPPSKPISSMNSLLVLLLGPDRLARSMTLFHFKLLNATSEAELMIQLLGRDQFSARLLPSNLDLLFRRFAQLQLWAVSEVLLAPDLTQRLAILRGLIQLTQRAKAHRDLLAMAAICLGLSTLPISRLGGLWSRLPGRIAQIHAQNQALLWPARGHRNYRLFARALRIPLIPFVPLLLKEMEFLHEGRPSHLADGLVNWEKMHILGRHLRAFRRAKGTPEMIGEIIDELSRAKQTQSDEALIKNLHIIEDQRELMRLSTGIQQMEGI